MSGSRRASAMSNASSVPPLRMNYELSTKIVRIESDGTGCDNGEKTRADKMRCDEMR